MDADLGTHPRNNRNLEAPSPMKVRWANDLFLEASIMGEAASTKPAAWSGPCP